MRKQGGSRSAFGCTQCGACCRLSAAPSGLPVKENGECVNLVGNLCSIYNDRPMVCRIDDLWAGLLADKMTRREAHLFGSYQCGLLQKHEGLGPEWEVKVP